MDLTPSLYAAILLFGWGVVTARLLLWSSLRQQQRLITAVLFMWAAATALPITSVHVLGVPEHRLIGVAFWSALLIGDCGLFRLAVGWTGWDRWVRDHHAVAVAAGSTYLAMWLLLLPAAPTVPGGNVETPTATVGFLILAAGPLAAAAAAALYLSLRGMRHAVAVRERLTLVILLLVSAIGLAQLAAMIALGPAAYGGTISDSGSAAIRFVTSGASPAYYLLALSIIAGLGPAVQVIDDWRVRRRISHLRPLWRAVTATVPEATLLVGASTPREQVTWMTTDIRDALVILGSYAPSDARPGSPGDSGAAAPADAVVAVQLLRQAMTSKSRSNDPPAAPQPRDRIFGSVQLEELADAWNNQERRT